MKTFKLTQQVTYFETAIVDAENKEDVEQMFDELNMDCWTLQSAVDGSADLVDIEELPDEKEHDEHGN